MQTILNVLIFVFTVANLGVYLYSVAKGDTKLSLGAYIAFVIIDGSLFFSDLIANGRINMFLLTIFLSVSLFLFISIFIGYKTITGTDVALITMTIALVGASLFFGENQLALFFSTSSYMVASIILWRKMFALPNKESPTAWVFFWVSSVLGLTEAILYPPAGVSMFQTISPLAVTCAAVSVSLSIILWQKHVKTNGETNPVKSL